MIKKYRKKPVAIEAVEFKDNADCLIALENLGMEEVRVDYENPDIPILKIHTLEGVMQANIGDYIIKGVNEEFYPCKPDIFVKTYDLI